MKVLFVSSGNHDILLHGTIHQGTIHHVTKNEIDSLIDQGINVDAFLIVGKGILGYLSNLYKLRLAIVKGNFNIIHAIGGHSGLAVILTGQYNNLCISYLGSDLQGDYSPKKFQNIFFKFFTTVIRLSSILPAKIIVKSKRMIESLPSKVKNKCHIIPDGVDFEVFKPMNMELAKKHLCLDLNKNLILFLGDKNDYNKNYILLQEAFKLIKNNAELLTPFPAPNLLIQSYLNACDILVLTSYKEGSPNVIKEAMACNCPIISTDVGDVKEVIMNTDNCYISGYNPEELAFLIDQVLENAKRTNGRSKINYLKKESIALKIKAVYNEIIYKHY